MRMQCEWTRYFFTFEQCINQVLLRRHTLNARLNHDRRIGPRQGCQMVYIFRPKMAILINFGRSCNVGVMFYYIWCILRPSYVYILWPFRKFYDNLVYVFFPMLVNCTKKNLATPAPGLQQYYKASPGLISRALNVALICDRNRLWARIRDEGDRP
jgi:hypothetical protein